MKAGSYCRCGRTAGKCSGSGGRRRRCLACGYSRWRVDFSRRVGGVGGVGGVGVVDGGF